jgi:prevent-host-death family protein
MATYHINKVKANLSALVTAAQKGEEVVITRYGKPVARISGLQKPKKRKLGFLPIHFQSDLLEPTDPAVIAEFYR